MVDSFSAGRAESQGYQDDNEYISMSLVTTGRQLADLDLPLFVLVHKISVLGSE
jgi:hypothetical protein